MTDEQMEALKRRAEAAKAGAHPDVAGQVAVLLKADDVLWLLGKAGKGEMPHAAQAQQTAPLLHETATPPPPEEANPQASQQAGRRGPQRKAGE